MTIINNRPDVAVVVLTRNAGELWSSWIEGIKRQSVRAGRYLVIDSSSSDGTAEAAMVAGFDVFSIDPREFNHGGTRQLAVQLCPDAKFIVYLTQDAILEQAESLQQLLVAMEDETVAMSYGRHIPRDDAGLLESHARSFTYPPVSSSRSRNDFEKLGFRAAFSSDVYACYRVSALRSVGGFPEKVIVSEDSYVTACLLLAGWRTVYSAQSKVRHSHQYTLLQVFRRYFDVGVFHANEAALLEGIGKPDKEAGVYVRSLISYLYQRRKILLPFAALQTFVKLVGFRLGKRYAGLPNWLCATISLQKAYWQYDTPTVAFGWRSLDVQKLLADEVPVNMRGVLASGDKVQTIRRADVSA